MNREAMAIRAFQVQKSCHRQDRSAGGAGPSSVAKTDGFTSQTFFDDDLTDNLGLDGSAELSVPKLGRGTYDIGILAVITKVADTPANGGAGLTLGNGNRSVGGNGSGIATVIR